MKLSWLWKNWPIHNLVAHPLSEIVHWVLWPLDRNLRISGWIHDVTIPSHPLGTGRG